MINVYCNFSRGKDKQANKKISIINQKTDVNKFEYINLLAETLENVLLVPIVCVLESVVYSNDDNKHSFSYKLAYRHDTIRCIVALNHHLECAVKKTFYF